MRLDIASISEVGERKRNEDCVDIIRSEAGTCVVLCDGLGGHEAGDLASACVCGSIRRRFEACTQEDKLEDLAYGLVLQAQDDLLQYQQELGKTGGMKTTACCLVIRDGKAAAAYVGDSRIYLIRKKKILCRSKDHSIPQYLVNIGEIKDADIRHHPDRNKLLRVMGSEWETPRHQKLPLPELAENDAFLLCSDGFWEWVEDKEMAETLRSSSGSTQWLEKMVELIYKRGSGKNMDNLSAIAVICRG